MKRLALFLSILGGGCVLVGVLLLFIPADHGVFRKALTIIGHRRQIEGTVIPALKPGLWIGGTLLLMLAGTFAFFHRRWSSRSRLPAGRFLMVLIAIQLALGALYVAFMPYQLQMGDDNWYFHQANYLGRGVKPPSDLTASPLPDEPSAFWPIGYPFVLALLFRILGAHFWVGQMLNLVLLMGITLVTYALGKSLFNSESAIRGALVTALIPSLIFISLPLLSELFFVFLFLLFIYLVQKPRSLGWSVLTGLCFGLATLTRPVVLFLPLLVLVYWILKDRRVKSALLHLAIIFVVGEMVLLPWQIRNYRTYGQFVLVSNNGGLNFWMGNNPYTPCYGPSYRFIADDETWAQLNQMNEAQRDRFILKVGMDYVLAHPWQAVKKWPEKLMHFYYRDSQVISWGLRGGHESVPGGLWLSFYIIAEGFYYALGIAFLIAAAHMLRSERLSARVVLLLGTIIYYTAIHLPFITEGRYHLPLLPLFVLIAIQESADHAGIPEPAGDLIQHS